METQDIKLFKILYSGEIESIESENIIQYFSDLKIIAFYVPQKKRLYTWIGKDCSSTLKNYIANMRHTFGEEFPYLRVLRYITVESMEEPFDFLSDVGISKQTIHEKLSTKREEYEKNQALVSKIKAFKKETDDYFENKQFKQAIESAREVIQLAREIDDDVLVKDQKNLIAEAKARLKAESILDEIRKEKKVIKEKLFSLEYNKSQDKVNELYDYVEQFKSKYSEYLKLSALQNVREVIRKVERLCEEYHQSNIQESQIQEAFTGKIEELREKAREALEKGLLKESFNSFKQISTLIQQKT